MLKVIGAWFGSVVGKVIAGILLVAIVVTVVKWQSVYDHARAAWWGLNNAQAVMHTANADTALTAAHGDSVRGAAATTNLNQLLVTPEIRSNPGAQRVGTAARVVISANNSEIGHLRTAVTESQAATASALAAGEKPVKRIQPYIDFGVARSLTKNYTVPVLRVGATYRIVSWAHAQGELSYEPPPTISQARMDRLNSINERDFARAEIRATVTGHIAF